MNVLLLLGSVIGVAGLLMAAAVSLVMGRPGRALLIAGAAGGWVVLYGAGLLAASLTSHEQVLPPGAVKRFCGFYLDCHIGVAVADDETVPAIGERHAAGRYHLLTIEVSSSARAATLTPYDLNFVVQDAGGTRYQRDLRAEEALNGPGVAAGINRAVAAGASYRMVVVFDLPEGVREPRLLATQGPAGALGIETVLIGDEDSFLHRPVLQLLPPPGTAARVSLR